MFSVAAWLRIFFKSLNSVASTTPSAPTLRRIWIMSCRLIEPSASRLWTSFARAAFCKFPELARMVTVAVPVTEPLLAVTVQLLPLLGAVNSPER